MKEELELYLEQSTATIRKHLAAKHTKDAELLLSEMLPFAGNNRSYIELSQELGVVLKKRKTRKLVAILLIVVVFLTSGLFTWFRMYQSKTEQEKWQATIDEDNIHVYQTYIAENKNSNYLPEANRNLQALLTNDSSLWIRAQTTQLQYDYKKYVEIMERSGGAHVEDAKTKIDSLDWVAIPKDADIAAFEDYLHTHPNGRFASLARNKISLEPTEAEKAGLLEYITSYFTAYENKDLETIMMFYSPITASFGSRRNLTKADLRLILENDLKSISNSSSKIDPSSFKIKKNEEGESVVTFNSDSYITRIKTETIDGSEAEKTATYYTNAQWFLTLDAYRKIISYKFKIISEQQINQ